MSAEAPPGPCGADFPRGKSRPLAKAIWTLLLLAAGAAAAAAAPVLPSLLLHLPWRINTSPSIPRGIYRRVEEPLRHDGLVAVCLPAALAAIELHRGFLGRGSCPSGAQPVLKKVLALPGDRLCLTPAGFVRGGRLLAATMPKTTDRRGRPLSHIPFGSYRVRPGAIWLYAPLPNSWDSRYWGGVPISAVRESLRPLWTPSAK
jgi:conjugative transfer signal peptidase TraF